MRDLIAVAERFAWRARRPLAIVVCGVPATGKSHVARALAELSGLSHLSSDVVRKRLAGVRTTERAPDATYSPEWNARTYAELGRLASDALASYGGVIVDATFRHRADRSAFTTALGGSRPTCSRSSIADWPTSPARGRRGGRRTRARRPVREDQFAGTAAASSSSSRTSRQRDRTRHRAARPRRPELSGKS